MYVKKIKRKCSMPGCKNTDTYSVSKGQGYNNPVIICEECALGIIEVIEATAVGAAICRPPVNTEHKPLFYGHLTMPAAEDEKVELPPEIKTAVMYKCSKCGREFTTAAGKANHERACKVN